MKAFLIDPKAQSITEVDYSGDYQDIYALIEADTFDVVRLYPTGDGAFIDDEGLLKEQEFFWAHRNYPGLLAGRGLVLGVDEEGESAAPAVTLQHLGNDITFTTLEHLKTMAALRVIAQMLREEEEA
ncbi:MAG: hypothetical protein ACK6EB_24620 [Planctomyces sp.]